MVNLRLESYYPDTIATLKGITNGIKLLNSPSDKKLIGYMIYEYVADKESHTLTTRLYKLQKNASKIPEYLKSYLKPEVRLQINDKLLRNLQNRYRFAQLLSTTIHNGYFFKKELSENIKQNENEKARISRVEFVSINIPYFGPPCHQVSGIMVLISKSDQSFIKSPIDRRSKKDKVDRLKEIMLKEWGKLNFEKMNLDAIEKQASLIKKMQVMQFPFAPYCYNSLGAYNKLQVGLKNCKKPRDITEYFRNVFINTAKKIFIEPKTIQSIERMTNEFLDVEGPLFSIPGYRDHFYHQYMVYILGLIILGNFPKSVFQNIFPDEKTGLRYDDILKTWYITANFHDFAYPIEKFSGVAANFIAHYSRMYNNPEAVFPNDRKKRTEILNINFDSSRLLIDPRHLTGLNVMAKWLKERICRDEKRSLFLSRLLKHLVDKSDHGVLSATIIHSEFEGNAELKKILPMATVPVAIHNHLFENPNYKYRQEEKNVEYYEAQNKIKDYHTCFNFLYFEKNPFTVLLALCDVVQDWGRVVFDEPVAISKFPYISNIETRFPSSNGDIYRGETLIELSYISDLGASENDFHDKCAELARTFSRIRSNEWKFSVKIIYGNNERTYETKKY